MWQEEEKAAKKKAVAAGLGGKEADSEVDLQAEEEVRWTVALAWGHTHSLGVTHIAWGHTHSLGVTHIALGSHT